MKSAQWNCVAGPYPAGVLRYWVWGPRFAAAHAVSQTAVGAFQALWRAPAGGAYLVRGTCAALAQAQQLARAVDCWTCGRGDLLRLQPHPWLADRYRIRCNGDRCDSVSVGPLAAFRPIAVAFARWRALPRLQLLERSRCLRFGAHLGTFTDKAVYAPLVYDYLYGEPYQRDELIVWVQAHLRPPLQAHRLQAPRLLQAILGLTDGQPPFDVNTVSGYLASLRHDAAIPLNPLARKRIEYGP